MASSARYFAQVSNKDDLPEVLDFAKNKNVLVVILGGGSNTVFASPIIHALVLQISISGFEKISEDSDSATFRFGAGEDWDSVVGRVVGMGFSGIESLSAIPGTVGGTPVQNVGAYGQEVQNVIAELQAYDRESETFVTLSNTECGFSYRDSIFKNKAKDRYIITSVTFKLSKNKPTVPNYPGVSAYFASAEITNPTLADIRVAITEIRKTKLPDPKNVASVGSFFKNPIVPKSQADELKSKYPTAVIFSVNDNESKIGAGWLIDTLGLKGKIFGHLMLYPNNALVIVNKGGATQEELKKLVADIQRQVSDTFGVVIQTEPIFVQ
jgi:UDP-N-acetylmuramate dehydrogenase